MNLKKILFFIFICCFWHSGVYAQNYAVKGKITDKNNKEPIAFAQVFLENTSFFTASDTLGFFKINNVPPGSYNLNISIIGYSSIKKNIKISDSNLQLIFEADPNIAELDEVIINSHKDHNFGIARLNAVEGTAIYSGKKSEVILMQELTANTSTNNTRQIYSKIPGLNIWESDGAGLQLGIGGRGLNPNRVSNFNTRQNGYDISADALGYPESYYAPPAEALERIEIVRGAASLQYGTQFGGFINFRMKKGPEGKPVEFTSRQTLGSFGFFNSFNSLGGSNKKINYYTFYQFKRGDGWRPNSGFDSHTAYGSINYEVNQKLSVSAEYTFMDYLAQQPGGLTDAQFAQNPRQSIRERNWFEVNWNLASVSADYKITDQLKINTMFFTLIASRSALGVLNYINRADPLQERDLWIDNFRNFGNETRLLYKYNLGNNLSAFLVGFRYYNGFTDRRQGLGNDGREGNRSDFEFLKTENEDFSSFIFPNSNQSLFAENVFSVNSKLSITPGIRFENIRTNANGFYYETNRDLAGNIILNRKIEETRADNRSFVLMGIGGSYQALPDMEFYSNISQNYRSINFNDIRIVNPNLQVDPNIRDEKGMTSDLGVRGSIKNLLNYDISLFLIRYNDRIGSVLKSDTISYIPYRFRTNISDSRNAGLESFVEADLWKLIWGNEAKTKLSLFSNFSWIDARYINSMETAYNNRKVELVPNVILKTGLNFKRNAFSLSYQFSYVSSQYTDASNAEFTSNAVNGIIPAYTVMDISSEYSYRNFTLAAGVNNLSNNMYFTRRADGYPGPGIIPSDGRSFYLSFQMKL